MKRAVLASIQAAVILIGGCSSLRIDQMPPRTPRDFLLDIEAVADSDDLANVGAVARRLRIDLIPGPEKPVYGNDGHTLLGYVVKVEEKTATKEYRSENFEYGTFTPTDRGFKRVRVSISVNSGVICVTPADVFAQFGEARQFQSPHTTSIGYTYQSLKNPNTETYFRFEKYGCLYKFGFFQTTEKG
jgi:hypothetical protein